MIAVALVAAGAIWVIRQLAPAGTALLPGQIRAADRGRAVHASEGCIKPGALQLRNASVVRPVSRTRAGHRMAARAVPRTPGLVARLIHRRDVS